MSGHTPWREIKHKRKEPAMKTYKVTTTVTATWYVAATDDEKALSVVGEREDDLLIALGSRRFTDYGAASAVVEVQTPVEREVAAA